MTESYTDVELSVADYRKSMQFLLQGVFPDLEDVDAEQLIEFLFQDAEARQAVTR